jgi:hypothetical protein
MRYGESGYRTGNRECHALDDQLLHEAAPTGPDRRTERNFTAPCCRAYELQTDDVGAGDQQE